MAACSQQVLPVPTPHACSADLERGLKTAEHGHEGLCYACLQCPNQKLRRSSGFSRAGDPSPEA